LNGERFLKKFERISKVAASDRTSRRTICTLSLRSRLFSARAVCGGGRSQRCSNFRLDFLFGDPKYTRSEPAHS